MKGQFVSSTAVKENAPNASPYELTDLIIFSVEGTNLNEGTECMKKKLNNNVSIYYRARTTTERTLEKNYQISCNVNEMLLIFTL